MRNLKTQGIIIKRRDISEADRIITAYTEDLGKIQIKAKGVRKITSRRSSHIELLNFSELNLYKGNALTLTEVQMIDTFEAIKNDLTKTGFAYHLCELIDGLCPEGQEQKQIFSLFKRTLEKLGEAHSDDILFIVHDFEIELLTLLGYWHKSPEASRTLDTQHFIEQILERRLKSRKIFAKLS